MFFSSQFVPSMCWCMVHWHFIHVFFFLKNIVLSSIFADIQYFLGTTIPSFILHYVTLNKFSLLYLYFRKIKEIIEEFPEIHQNVLLHLCSRCTNFFTYKEDTTEPSRWDHKKNHSGWYKRFWSIYPSISSQLYL